MNPPKKLVVGNWKMNTTIAEGSLLLNRLRKELGDHPPCDVVLCAPYTHLFALHSELGAKSSFKLGAQNVSEHEEGSFTGEISASMVRELVGFVLVGHSERRKYLHETDKEDGQKITTCLRHHLTPILCVGESHDERSNGNAKQVVLDQLNTDLHGVTEKELSDIVVAYEPVWAIGSGNFAKPAMVEEMIMLIRNTLTQRYGRMASMKVRILYGGSVVPDNAKTYLKLQGVDGLLVGGASLNYKQFVKIVQSASSLSS